MLALQCSMSGRHNSNGHIVDDDRPLAKCDKPKEFMAAWWFSAPLHRYLVTGHVVFTTRVVLLFIVTAVE